MCHCELWLTMTQWSMESMVLSNTFCWFIWIASSFMLLCWVCDYEMPILPLIHIGIGKLYMICTVCGKTCSRFCQTWKLNCWSSLGFFSCLRGQDGWNFGCLCFVQAKLWLPGWGALGPCSILAGLRLPNLTPSKRCWFPFQISFKQER